MATWPPLPEGRRVEETPPPIAPEWLLQPRAPHPHPLLMQGGSQAYGPWGGRGGVLGFLRVGGHSRPPPALSLQCTVRTSPPASRRVR